MTKLYGVVFLLVLVTLVTAQFVDYTAGPKLSAKLKWLNSEQGQEKIIDPALLNAYRNEEYIEVNDEPLFERKLQDGIPITINVINFNNLVFVSNSVVFGSDNMGQIWISKDNFMTWTLTPIDPKDNIRGIYPSPVDNNTVLFLGGWSRNANNASWVTHDLSTFTRVPTNQAMANFLWHPVNSTWAMGTSRGTLFLSMDSGATWTSVRDSLTFATWCHAGLYPNVPPERICMITTVVPEDLGLPDSTTDERVGPSRFVRTEDFGNTIEVPFAMAVNYLIVHPLFFFVMSTDPRTGMADLFVSNDHGNSWQNAKLPADVTIPYLWDSQLLDDTTGAIWIGVNHQNPIWQTAMPGSIYVSDTDGYNFALTLDHVVNYNNWWDLSIIRSVEGSYLSNTLVHWRDDDNIPTNNIALLIKTLITWDNGRTWGTLTPPTVDANGVPYNCSDIGCTLNLFGLTTWLGVGGESFYGDFYSAPGAVGLVLATGNVGQFLTFPRETVNTYLSRDAGQTWIEIMKNSTVYEYGDDGGIIVVVPNQVDIYECYYSLDEGLTWNTITLSTPDKPITVVTLFSTDTSGEQFVIRGWYQSKMTYFGINLSGIQEQFCTSSDYEMWSLQTGSCVLGRNTIYSRRKRTAECDNPPGYIHVVSVTNCNCTKGDYECDFGFERTVSSGICANILSFDEQQTYINEQCMDPFNNGQYEVSKGYRIVPGDSCVNPLSMYQPTWMNCQASSTGSSASTGMPVSTSTGSSGNSPAPVEPNSAMVGLLTIAFLIVTLGSLVGGMCLGARSERVRTIFGKKESHKYARVEIDLHEDDRFNNDE